jgi:hypothetical protein
MRSLSSIQSWADSASLNLFQQNIIDSNNRKSQAKSHTQDKF